MQLAIERLGARLVVAPKLISDGVDALKGNENVRLANAKLLLGLSWGGVAAQMRMSTACVRAFLLISSIKMCAYDDRIAEIIYEYLSNAKLLDLEPVSVRQIESLVDILSGYSDALLPDVQHTMNEVIQSVANQGPNNWPRSCFERLDIKGITEIFLRCFEAIQQDEGGYVELSGQDGLIWIATVLLWLNPDEVGLFSQGHLLFGAAQGKVRILVAEDRRNWKIGTWKAGKSIATAISSADYWVPEHLTSSKIPKRIVRYSLRIDFNEVELDLVGALAAGLIDIVLRLGTLDMSKKSRRSGSYFAHCAPVQLKLLYKQEFVERGGCVMEEYGWELDNIRAHAADFLTGLSELSGQDSSHIAN